jgi:hypothetical protein
MTHMTVWRVRVPEASVAELLAVRDAGIAEAQRLCPELTRAQLVRTPDGEWLDVLTWSAPDGEERLMARAAEFDALNRMHAAVGDELGAHRGEVVHDTGTRAA